MPDFQLLSDRTPARLDLGDWAFRLAVALLFVMFGYAKFDSRPDAEWVRIFRQIGLGQWFRYFTGIVEVAGGLLVLIPKTALLGLATLAVTMAGAMVAHLLALHDGFFAAVPAVLFGALAAMVYQRWNR